MVLGSRDVSFRLLSSYFWFLLSTSIVLLLAVELFEGFELLDEGFVLVLQHGHSVLQALDVFLLLAPAFPGRFPVLLKAHLPLAGLVL